MMKKIKVLLAIKHLHFCNKCINSILCSSTFGMDTPNKTRTKRKNCRE
jgi:hypothetical protein